MMTHLIVGIAGAFSPLNVGAVAGGVALGMLVGAIPGLNAPMAIAIGVPMTYYMPPLAAIGMLTGIMKGSPFGGSIPAILLNTPGTPDAVVTAFDGYPLGQQGKAEKALKMSLFSTSFGDFFSDFALILCAAPLAAVAVRLGPIEITAVLVFSLTIIASLGGNSLLKGLIAASTGLLASTVGLDPETGTTRLTFGIPQLDSGISLVAVGIGLLALGEVIRQIELTRRGGAAAGAGLKKAAAREDRRVSWAEYRKCLRTLLRSAFIGTGVGILPGLGSTLAAILGYAGAKRASKEAEKFGHGHLEGIAACEAATTAVSGGALIPLLALGIPGNVAAAMLIGAFVIHGITPGPLILQNHQMLVYGLFGSLLIADVMNLLIGQIGLRLFARIASVPSYIIYPVVVLLCLTGAYISGDGMFAVGMTVAFGVLGYVMRYLDVSYVIFIIAFVLGPMFERSFRQSLILTGGSVTPVVHHPIALVFLALSAYTVYRALIRSARGVRLDPERIGGERKETE